MILVSFSQSLNVLSAIDVIGPLMVIPVRFLHPRNAPSPIEVTFFGMTMLSRPEFLNAPIPIDIDDTVLGILMDFNPEQLEKAVSPIEVTEFGIIMDVRLLQLLNIPLLNNVRPLGSVTSCRFEHPWNA